MAEPRNDTCSRNEGEERSVGEEAGGGQGGKAGLDGGVDVDGGKRNACAPAEDLAAAQSIAAGLGEENRALQEHIEALKAEVETSRSQERTALSNPPIETVSIAQPVATLPTEPEIPSPLLIGAAVSNTAVVTNDPAVSNSTLAPDLPTGRPFVRLKIIGVDKGSKSQLQSRLRDRGLW